MRLLANRHIESDTHAGLNALRPCMDDRIYIYIEICICVFSPIVLDQVPYKLYAQMGLSEHMVNQTPMVDHLCLINIIIWGAYPIFRHAQLPYIVDDISKYIQ